MIAFAATGLMVAIQSNAQMDKMVKKPAEDKSKRPSPPAKVSEKLKNGATISIDYSKPSIKGRKIGKDIEPMEGKVWRTGANEATVFETDKDVMVMGKKIPAGKYGLFTIFNGKEATIIFNKTWDQWGAFNYKAADDFLRVTTKVKEENMSTETMTFMISPKGIVMLHWGMKKVEFEVM